MKTNIKTLITGETRVTFKKVAEIRIKEEHASSLCGASCVDENDLSIVFSLNTK